MWILVRQIVFHFYHIMPKIHHLLYHYRYRILLGTLIIFLLVFLMRTFAVQAHFSQHILFQINTSIIIIIAIILSYGKKQNKTLIISWWLSLIGIRMMSWAEGDALTEALLWLFTVLFFLRLTYIVIKTIIKEKNIGPDLFAWCIVWFIMIAISGFFMFMALDGIYDHQWFSMNAAIVWDRLFSLLYYSFMTITTVWYGDIIPTNSVVEFAVMMYSIVWWSYTTFVLAMVLKKFD